MKNFILRTSALILTALLVVSLMSCHNLKKNRYDRCRGFSKVHPSADVQLRHHG